MYRPGPQRGPSTRSEWIITILLVGIFLGFLAAEIFQNFTPVKLMGLLVCLFWIPLLAIHEAGHAIAAYLLGWRVREVVIGVAKKIGQFRVGRARVEIRIIPVEGFVKCVPKNLRAPQLKSALIYFAGPGVELLLALCVLLLVGSDQLLRVSDNYWIVVWQSLALAAAAQAVMNLIPFPVHDSNGGTGYSDGLGIIVSFLRPRSYYARLIGW
jgi:hypothetical protein